MVTMSSYWLVVVLWSWRAMAKERVLFISGVPRSGTSLFTRFLQLHEAETELRTNTRMANTLEFRPSGAKSYGGSERCLAGMAAYARGPRKTDFARHDAKLYALGNESEKMTAIKDPGNLLSIGEQQASCERNGFDCWFLLVYASPFEWESNKISCEPNDRCRKDVVKHWVEIHREALANRGNASVRAVSLDAAASTPTYEAIETWLGLTTTVPLRLVKASRRRLVLHGNGLQVNNDTKELIVEEDHLAHRCEAPENNTPQSRAENAFNAAAYDILDQLHTIDVLSNPFLQKTTLLDNATLYTHLPAALLPTTTDEKNMKREKATTKLTSSRHRGKKHKPKNF